MRTLLLLILGSFLCSLPAQAPTPKEDEALRLLRAMDERVYDAESAGLEALAFTFRPKFQGVSSDPFRVRYSWRKGVGDRVDFLDNQGAPLKEIPKIPELEKAKEVKDPGAVLAKHFLVAARSLAAPARGRRFAKQYANFNRRVSRRIKNGIEWTSLILEPAHPKRLRRLTVTLDRNGLPWQWERRLLDGSVMVEQHSYMERDGRFILKDVTWTLTAPGKAVSSQYATRTTWQRVKGFLIPATITKDSPALPEWNRGATSLEDAKVNSDVPAFTPVTSK